MASLIEFLNYRYYPAHEKEVATPKVVAENFKDGRVPC